MAQNKLLELELAAAASLIKKSARDYRTGADRDWPEKLRLGLRGAVLRCEYDERKREHVPHEMLTDEYHVVLSAVQEWKDQPTIRAVRADLGQERKAARPLPWFGMPQVVTRASGEPSDIAHEVVSARFAVGVDTVRKWCSYVDYRGDRPTAEQSFLASVFLDACREMRVEIRRPLMGNILAALAQLDYCPLKLYYLVQRANDLDGEYTIPEDLLASIRALCDAAEPEDTPPSVFRQVVDGC